jgi:hypothetical protein
VIETDPSSSFDCEYPAGINRVLSLPPYLLIDNIARNVEIWRLDADGDWPVARARYDCTTYPGDADASLLDLDIHAAFIRNDAQELITVNHFGRVRRFALPPATVRMFPTGERQLLGDMERVVLVGDAFIGSSPRGEYTDDEARPGLFLFEPIRSWDVAAAGRPARVACEQVLADWGVVSALAVASDNAHVAVAAGQRLGIFGLKAGPVGLRLDPCVVEATLPFGCQWLQFDEAGRIWTAGHDSHDTGGDWDACRGGQLLVLSPHAEARELVVELPDVTAWGYGADPIVLAAGGGGACVLGRDGSLHAIDVTRRTTGLLYRPVDAPGEAGARSLGIGHAARHDGSIYAGFSRGGFCLFRYALPSG